MIENIQSPSWHNHVGLILFLNRAVNYEGIYRIVKVRIWKDKIAVRVFFLRYDLSLRG
jgi:hypothetical protein